MEQEKVTAAVRQAKKVIGEAVEVIAALVNPNQHGWKLTGELKDAIEKTTEEALNTLAMENAERLPLIKSDLESLERQKANVERKQVNYHEVSEKFGEQSEEADEALWHVTLALRDLASRVATVAGTTDHVAAVTTLLQSGRAR